MITIVAANPAGNITALVGGAEQWGRPERESAVRAILNDKTLKAEQVGFVYRPSYKPDAKNPLWHLEMAGGEFCGNAARSLGLYAAQMEGRHGRGTITITVSGAEGPLNVDYEFFGDAASDETRGFASLAMPPPRSRKIIICRNTGYPLYIFDGIQHIIGKNIEPDDALFFELKSLAEQEVERAGAFGVMFCGGAQNHWMRPAVYVRDIDVLTYESSCGSGSAAYACDHFDGMADGEGRVAVRQPGGIIEVHVRKTGGHIDAVSIGGTVILKPYAASAFCRL
jgi:diaminopimelate epimerase